MVITPEINVIKIIINGATYPSADLKYVFPPSEGAHHWRFIWEDGTEVHATGHCVFVFERLSHARA